ncbi:nuclease-related domain-containing protein [Palaeococcus pacificus]|nr:nuclease-related domain-containing protein [Palaeococcus pacificus]
MYLGFFTLIFTLREYNRHITWKKGFEGEFRVIEEFNYPESVILSDIHLPNRRGNIDHVIVNSKGIFVLETKNYSGEYYVNGDVWTIGSSKKRKRRIRSPTIEAKREASAISSLLKRVLKKEYYVQPLIVLTGDAIIWEKTKSTVPIFELEKLDAYLNQFPNRLTKEEVLKIVSVLEKYAQHVKET